MVKIQPSVNPDIKNKTFKNVKKNGKVQKKKNESSSEKNILVEEMVEKTTKKLNKKFKAKNIEALSEDDTSNVEDRSSQDECDQLESDSEDLREETKQVVEVTGNNTSLDVQGSIGNDKHANNSNEVKIIDEKRLVLNNLSCNTTVADILKLFPKSKINIISIKSELQNDLDSQNSAWIVFNTWEEAKQAFEMGDIELNGRKLQAFYEKSSATSEKSSVITEKSPVITEQSGIFMKNVPTSWESHELNNIFAGCGEIHFVRHFANPFNKGLKNCLISFKRLESDAAALKLNGTKINNYVIMVTKYRYSTPQQLNHKAKFVKKPHPFNKPSFRGPPFNKPSFNNRNHFMKPPNSSLNEVNLEENMMKQIENNILKKIASHLAE